MGQPSHGTILFIQEILEDPAAHPSVRTFGKLQGVDSGGDGEGFTLEDEGGRTLAVDATLLSDQVRLRKGSLYMVIGEVAASGTGVVVRARVARNVDGMDLDLMRAALKVRRDFETSLSNGGNAPLKFLEFSSQA